MSFIGRTEELAKLNKLYNSEKFEFVVIYGRRQVGKTKLITTFCQNKKSIYFFCSKSEEKANLERFSNDINLFEKGTDTNQYFKSFYEALEYVFKLAEKERIILALDEYPYIAKQSKGFNTILQLLIDKYRETSKLMLIISGSLISYMEDEVMAYKAPLYGRKTAQMKIGPLEFEKIYTYLEGFSPIDKALIYGCFGGTPKYIADIDKNKSFEDNIKELYLDSSSYLNNEPENLINLEIPEYQKHELVIEAIANGNAKMADISNYCGFNSPETTTYLKTLIELTYVKKDRPYGENSSRKTLYMLDDNMFRFWYRFIYKNLSVIKNGVGDSVYKKIEPYFNEYMGLVFEDISKQYLWKLRREDKCPIDFLSLGRWWGPDPKTRIQEEIDIVGEEDKTTALLGECKWTNDDVDVSVLDKLIERSKLLKYTKIHFFLFSKNGFTDGCKNKANEYGNVTLVKYQDMFEDR